MWFTLALVSQLATVQVPTKAKELAPLLEAVEAKKLERTVRDLVAFGTRHTLSTTKDKKRGIEAARFYIQKRLATASMNSRGRMLISREPHPAGRRGKREIEVVNYVAEIRGTVEPERVYVISGHYDSRNTGSWEANEDAPGANDDGSGTAAVLELADILATVPMRATVRLVCYDGEEIGLRGSRADAKALKESGTKVDGMITLDIVGNTEAADGRRERGYVRVFSYQDAAGDSTGRNLARVATHCARRYLNGFAAKLVFRGDRYGRGGDHRPFKEAGWPAMRMTEPYENFSRQHKNVIQKDGKPYGDLPDYMDFDYLANVTRLAMSVIYELANAPPAPRSIVVRGTPTLGTRAWIRPGAMPDYLAGFEVVWRDTTAADWEGAHFVARKEPGRRGIQVELPKVLLDNSIVGVRSVAKDGARSRVVSAREPGSRRR